MGFEEFKNYVRGLNKKGISTVISAILTHIILGNVYTWSNINHYLASYMNIEDNSIVQTDCFFIVPVTILFDTYVIFFSGFFERKLGTRILSSFACIGGVSCHLIIYLTKKFWMIMFGFVLYGLGIGMGYYPILKTTWKYFPEKKGFLTGLILCVFGLCPFVFTSVADAVINGEGKPTREDGLFEPDIAENMKDFSLIMVIVMGACGILSQFLMFPMDDVISTDNHQIVVDNENNKNNSQDPKASYVSNEIYNQEKDQNNLDYNYEPVEDQKEKTKTTTVNEPFMQAFKSWRFHLFNFMSVGTLFFVYFSTNTSRAFASRKKTIDEPDLQTMSKICGLLNGAFRISWGFVYDALGFKIPYTIVTTLQIIVSATFYFSVDHLWSYYITNILENVVFAGHGTIAPPIVSKIFGMKNTVTLIGITGYYIGSAGFLGPVIAKFVIKDDQKDSDVSDFLTMYLIGCGFAIMGFIICIFTKEDKFQYKPIDIETNFDETDGNDEDNKLVKESIGSTT